MESNKKKSFTLWSTMEQKKFNHFKPYLATVGDDFLIFNLIYNGRKFKKNYFKSKNIHIFFN